MTDSENSGHPDPHGTPAADDGGDVTEQFQTPRTAESPRAYSQQPPRGTAQFEQSPPTDQHPPDGFTPIPPQGPDQDHGAGTGVVASSPAKRSRAKRSTGKIIGASVAGLVIVVIIALVGSELYLRHKTENCLENAFSDLTGTQTSVSLSHKPILLQGLGKDLPFVQVDTKDKPNQMRLHGRADDIRLGDNTSRIGSLVGTGFVPYDRVVALSKGASGSGQAPSGGGSDPTGTGLMQGASIDSLSGNAADGTIEVKSTVQVTILPIPVSTTLRPTLQNGRIHFQVVKANALIFGIPPDFAQRIVDNVTGSMFGPFFNEVTIKSMKVTDSGVDFAVDGRDVALQDQVSRSNNCSMV